MLSSFAGYALETTALLTSESEHVPVCNSREELIRQPVSPALVHLPQYSQRTI